MEPRRWREAPDGTPREETARPWDIAPGRRVLRRAVERLRRVVRRRVAGVSERMAARWLLKNPANRHKAVGLTFEQWSYTFTNGLPEDEARRLYERYHVPASGEVFWGSALANIHPGRDDTWVDYPNEGRAPLLFISGSHDHLMPPSIQRSNAKHWNDSVITEVKQFEGPHLLPASPGWENVADYALDWAQRHARRSSAV